VDLTVDGPVWHWRGPSPHHFVTVGAEQAAALEAVSGAVSYGWGMIPVTATLGSTTWRTALWPKNGSYLVPPRDSVRRAEQVDVGDVVTVQLAIAV